MRTCPPEFQAELTRIGGVNQYNKPIFKLVWSQGERMTIGGRWDKDGFIGYKQVPSVPGDPCWALMVWEPCEAQGTYESWMRDYRDEETGLLQCGGYPKYGAYRVLQKFIHREIVQQAEERCFMRRGRPQTEIVQTQKLRTYRMEPCGLILDIMLPMLMAWRRLSNAQKVAALKQKEREKNEEYSRQLKDAMQGSRLGRTMRGSQLVQKRAEVIENGMKQAMARAAAWGLGSAIMN